MAFYVYVFRKLVRFDEWCNLAVHVAMDNVVVTEDVLELCQGTSSFKPLLLIVPLRLGISEINPIYFEGLKRYFEIPGCVGMIGGRPNQALYFIGHVGDEALYLDPHTTQNSGSVGNKATDEEIEMDGTFHQKFAMRIDFRAMDPSLAVGFLCRNRDEFDQLCRQLTTDSKSPPLFEISAQRLKPWMTAAHRHESDLDSSGLNEDFEEVDIRQPNSDEDFEIIT